MESEFNMPPSLEKALIELAKEVGELASEVRVTNANVAKVLDKHERRDDEIEAKADEANDEIKAVKNKAVGIGIGSALGGGGFGAFLMKIFA